MDGEIGGNDQVYNMLIGRDLVKKIQGREKFVIGTKLLVDSVGAKMGKTTGNMISLKESAQEMFGKVMSWTDGMILPGFELCTNVPTVDISKIKAELDRGVNPRDLKIKLAKEIVTIYHGADKADLAEKNFIETFKNGGVPEKIDEVSAANGELLSDLSVKAGIVKSKGEFRRLVLEKAVSNQETGDKILDPNFKVADTSVFKIGKRRFLRVVVK